MRQRTTVVVLLLFLLISGSLSLYAAGPAPIFIQQQGTEAQFPQCGDDVAKPDPEIEKKMAKARLEDRYKNLKRDSEKLLELATELKQYVDKSNQDVLSLEVVRKCDEIEKLAKSVKTKMKGN